MKSFKRIATVALIGALFSSWLDSYLFGVKPKEEPPENTIDEK